MTDSVPPALMTLRRDLRVALAVAASGFLLNLTFGVTHRSSTSWSQNASEDEPASTGLSPAIITSGWRVDFLDLALCALALTMALRARRAFLERVQTTRLPPAEQWWWLGSLAMSAIKLLTAVRLYP